ncbi:hypothetical protein BJY52DRAFT_1127783 [Lactarius psammicola]|nr:hypothetical protein BJY52DRAFT_1127783 [Lactarius psammicola]
MAVVAGGNGAGVAPPTTTTAPAPAHRGAGVVNATTNGPPPLATTELQAATPHERPTLTTQVAASPSGPQEYLKLGNGTMLCFSKQSIPDPPSVSFAKDLPQLMRTWDDSLPEWSPLEAVLRVQGEPIALKHWPVLYRYGKPGQWAGTKKTWAHWRDIATSWQELGEDGFWRRFSTNQRPMSYTAICEALKEERMATHRRVTEQAKVTYGNDFGPAFIYRRGSEHIVRNKESAIAKRYHTLQASGSSP